MSAEDNGTEGKYGPEAEPRDKLEAACRQHILSLHSSTFGQMFQLENSLDDAVEWLAAQVRGVMATQEDSERASVQWGGWTFAYTPEGDVRVLSQLGSPVTDIRCDKALPKTEERLRMIAYEFAAEVAESRQG